MARIPGGLPNIPGGGRRQQRAAELKREMETRQREQEEQKQAEEEAKQQAEQEAQEQDTGPVGDGDYEVRNGDCISSIAKDTGHFWETIWNDPGNAELRETRRNPNILLPGDQVTIPELKPQQEPGETEMRHRFVRRGEPAKLRLRLLQGPAQIDPPAEAEPQQATGPQADRPWGNVPYRLVVDDNETDGTADADGWIMIDVPGNAENGKLILNPETDQEQEIRLNLGRVSPLSEIQGVRQRLRNLGFDVERGDSDELTTPLRSALRAFQAQNDIDVTGEPDEATRSKLLEVHGC